MGVLDSAYLVVVHGDVQLVVQFESQTPDDPPEPQAVVGIHRLRLGSNVQDVFTLVQRTHILTFRIETHCSYCTALSELETLPVHSYLCV